MRFSWTKVFMLALVLHSGPSYAHGPGAGALCESILRAIEVLPAGRRQHPVHEFFATVDLVRERASLALFTSQLDRYREPRNLVVPEAGRPFASERRIESATRYRGLYLRAADLGQDQTLKQLHLAVVRVSRQIDDALRRGGFDSHFKRPSPEVFAATLDTNAVALESAVGKIRESWDVLDESVRDATLDWLGLAVVDGLCAGRRCRIDLTKLDHRGQPISQIVPAFPKAHRSLERFVATQGHPPAEAKHLYYRDVARRILGIYGAGPRPDLARLVSELVYGE